MNLGLGVVICPTQTQRINHLITTQIQTVLVRTIDRRCQPHSSITTRDAASGVNHRQPGRRIWTDQGWIGRTVGQRIEIRLAENIHRSALFRPGRVGDALIRIVVNHPPHGDGTGTVAWAVRLRHGAQQQYAAGQQRAGGCGEI